MVSSNHLELGLKCEKIKANLKWEKHPRGGWIGFLKILFKHNKSKHNRNK